MRELARRTLSSDFFWSGLGALLVLAAGVLIAAGLVTHSTPVVVAGVLAAIGCAAILFQPFLGILLFLTLLYLRPEQFYPQLAELRLPLLLSSFTLFAWLVQLMLRRETFRWRAELGWMIAFALMIALSAFMVPSGKGLLDGVMESAKLALMFVLLLQLLNTPQRARITLQLFLALSVVLALYAIHGWVTGASVLHDRGMARAIVAVGDFDDPNDLAAALVIPIPLAIYLLLKGRGLAERIGGGLAAGVLLLGVYLCNSRGGLLALGVGMAVVLVHHQGWVRGLSLGAGMVLLLALFGPAHFIQQTSLATDDSAMGRVEAWQAGLRMMERSPLLGVGYEQFEARHAIPAHNSFVHALGEGGFLTALAWVGLNYWAILTLVRLMRRREDSGDEQPARPGLDPGYAAALLGGLLASLTAGMFLSHTYRPVPLLPVALAAALGALAYNAARPRLSDWRHYLAVVGVTLVGVAVFYGITAVLL